MTFPDDPEKQAVVDAAYAFFDAARAAQASPADEALRAQLAETMVDPIAARLTDFLNGLVADDLRITGSANSPTYLDIEVSTVLAVQSSGTFEACVVDSDVQVRNSDGSVVDDDVVSTYQTYSLERVQNSWRVRDFSVFATWEDQAGCG